MTLPEQQKVKSETTTAASLGTRAAGDRRPSLVALVVQALSAGFEGAFSHTWKQDEAEAGFWMPLPEYLALKDFLAALEGQGSPVARSTPDAAGLVTDQERTS